MRKYLIPLLALLSFNIAAGDEPDCERASSTPDINWCAAVELGTAQQELKYYLEEAIKRHADDAELIAAIHSAQADWEKYAESHCDAIYTYWREGTIRSVMELGCKRKLTKQRTHEIWAGFLTYMDSTPPVLPEPVW